MKAPSYGMLFVRYRRRLGRSGLVFAVFTLLAAAASGQTIAPLTPLNFGTFIVNGSGSISISSYGIRTTTGGIVLLGSDAGAAARFTVVNNTGSARNCGALSLAGNGTLLQIKDIVAVQSDPVGFVAGAAAVTVKMGATLQVSAGQQPGSYSGGFAVNVECSA